MHKAILILLLAIVSNSAMAEWIEVTSTDKETYYVNSSTIRKNGHMVKIWELVDVKPSGFTKMMQGLDDIFEKEMRQKGEFAMSTKTRHEYDCNEEQSRILFLSTHTGNMGEGEVIISNSDSGKWQQIVPGSIGESLWKFACGKK